MDNKFIIGDIVKSLLGHDKDNLFIVVSIDKNGYLAIIDGRYRPKERVKTKNPKHLMKVAHDDEILAKVNSPIVTNREIYNAIKRYRKE